jgi:hypothetical protein
MLPLAHGVPSLALSVVQVDCWHTGRSHGLIATLPMQSAAVVHPTCGPESCCGDSPLSVVSGTSGSPLSTAVVVSIGSPGGAIICGCSSQPMTSSKKHNENSGTEEMMRRLMALQ